MNNLSPSVEDSGAVDGNEQWNNTMNNTTFSEMDYLQTHLGARYRSLAESLVLSVIYVIILVTGVVGRSRDHRCVVGR